MKSSHLITLGISSVAIATGLYLSFPNSPTDDTRAVSGDTSTTPSLIQKNQKSAWDILADATAQADTISEDILSDRDLLIEFMNNNPTLRLRIQNTSWYRDFVSGGSWFRI